MPENRKVQNNGGVSNSSVENIEEAIRRLKIQTNDNEGSDEASNPYPDRPGEPDCIYYLRTGLCGYGSNCKFNHPAYVGHGGQYGGEFPERFGQPDCGFFLKTGTCKYGSTCKYHHPLDRHRIGTVPLNSLGLPIRQEEKPCPYYMRTGLCKFGAMCKFHHPEPALAGSLQGPTMYGSTGSSIVPSSNLSYDSYVGGISAWSLPRAPYLSNPSVQGPQTYMPVVLSPSQGTTPAQGWNTYLGSMNPVSSTSVFESNPLYNYKNQGDSGYSGQLQMLSTTTIPLPERPDQPECRYFMNNGICKYGYDCKYNHPRERIVQVATNSLGPLGLPLRPGQAVCSFYRQYGLCKYGPNCKFDHPLAAYSYNYSLSYPTVTMLDPYQKTLMVVNSSETSPSNSKSSKFPDWIQKPEATRNKSQKLDAKMLEDAPEQTGSPPCSSPGSSERPHDQSE